MILFFTQTNKFKQFGNLLILLFLVAILFAYLNIKAASQGEIKVDQSYTLEVENRKANVLEVKRVANVVKGEIADLVAQKAEKQKVVDNQQKKIDIKNEAVKAEKEILQQKLDALLTEEEKKSKLEQEVLRKQTEIDAKKVDLAGRIKEIARRKNLVEQALADVKKQKQLLVEQKQAEKRDNNKRKLLKQLEVIRSKLNELGVNFTGATANAASQNQTESLIINSQLKQCKRNIDLIDNRDGTISDRNTGLMWQKCSLGEKYNSDSNICLLYAMASNSFNISERLRLFNREQEFLNRYSRDRGGSSYYSDWRLSTITELKSLVKEPCAQDPTYYYSNMFSATKEDRYISSSLNNAGQSIFLDFKTGQVKNDIPESSGYVRLVR